MARIRLEVALDETERNILAHISRNGELKASKPKVKKEDQVTGRSAYVWRMVAFQVSKNPKHHCMPCTANFDFCKSDWENRREVEKELDDLVKRVVDAIPVHEWHGIKRWGNAFGLIGSPQVASDGAIIYR